MGCRYAVRTVVLESGERLPLLLNCDTGIPLFEATLYSITELRARSRASATIQQALRSVLALYKFLDARRINLDARLAEGRLLQLSEIDDLARECRLPIEALGASGDPDASPTPPVRLRRASSLEKVRMRSPAPLPEIDPGSAGLRLRYIRAYFGWLTAYRLQRIDRNEPLYAALASASELAVRALGQRIPSSAAKDFVGKREGLSAQAQARLNQVIGASSPDNPWKNAHARERNELMVRWLQALGLRRGELLGIRIPNIDFQANRVRITRQADDPNDPRVRQPNTKTRGRLLALEDDLIQLTRHYILNARAQFNGASRHDFLFVATGTGAPLTEAAVDRVFTTLREKCPDLPNDLTAHVLRHTWNDCFSELMDANRVSQETEQKVRARLMGWSETSNTAAIYTRRHIQRRAHEAALQLQRSLRRAKNK
jgi:integrase